MRFTLNGARRAVRAHPMKRLLDVLREDCGLTGTKEGCGEGECGACTVLVDGAAVNACLVPFAQVGGARVVTIEGLGDPEHLHPLQSAFIEHGAVQCGYCIPAMILTAKSFLDERRGHVPSEAEVREALSGTLCRCTGYQKIVEAVIAAARQLNSWPEEARRAS